VDLDALLQHLVEHKGSDLHLKAGSPPHIRVDGRLEAAPYPAVSASDTERIAFQIMPTDRADEFASRNEADFAHSLPGLGRFRVNVYRQRSSVALVFRRVAPGTPSFEALGLPSAVQRLAEEPRGLVLVTGPTGSGKTTTLYAAISEINHGRDKIITIEDPVEYQLPGVLQIPVNEKKGLTFARGLRSILRHDPDKIMVGEIRDADTAQIAVQSALTGHLVFTTVHANNVFDVIGRFIHMGVDPYSFVSALNGIVAQRLLRINCPHCAAPVEPSAELLELSGLTADKTRDYTFLQGSGCGHCRGSGYKGRRAIAETLLLTDELRELIVARAPIGQIKEAAQRGGTRTLRDAALARVKAGDTTLEEINRVTLAV
jgi:pilus retraction protein PilT